MEGLGWYNLRTAQANSTNVDSMIRWKKGLREIQKERWAQVAELHAKQEAQKKLRHEEIVHRREEFERQLRYNPTPADIHSGKALNALLYDLTDPDIHDSDWQGKTVKLPEGMSVKDLVFRFTPQSGSSQTSRTLSKGVIALSRLSVSGSQWPTMLSGPEIAKERLAYETAYAKVSDEILAGEFDLKSVHAMDDSIHALRQKVQTAVSEDRGFRVEATKYVDDLIDGTRMFDASTADYAREMLKDTNDHEAATVAELVAFTLKYRLQFAGSERSPITRELYVKLFAAMQEQHQGFSAVLKAGELAMQKERGNFQAKAVPEGIPDPKAKAPSPTGDAADDNPFHPEEPTAEQPVSKTPMALKAIPMHAVVNIQALQVNCGSFIAWRREVKDGLKRITEAANKNDLKAFEAALSETEKATKDAKLDAPWDEVGQSNTLTVLSALRRGESDLRQTTFKNWMGPDSKGMSMMDYKDK